MSVFFSVLFATVVIVVFCSIMIILFPCLKHDVPALSCHRTVVFPSKCMFTLEISQEVDQKFLGCVLQPLKLHPNLSIILSKVGRLVLNMP